jgi:antitoxin ParD1/3/4
MTMSYNIPMASRATKPVTVTLGALTEMAQGHVVSGRYASVSEVVRAGLRALEREENMLDALLKAKVEAVLANPVAAIPQAEVFADLRLHHSKHTSR